MIPSVTFVVTHYNAEQYLHFALESITGQTCKDYEVVVVDDCSQTPPEVNDVYLIRHNENLGPHAAFNSGFKHARTKYVAKLDCDDTIEPNYLEALLPILASNNTLGYAAPDSGPLLWPDILERNNMNGGALFAKWAWEKVGGYESLPHPQGYAICDWDLWCKIAKHNIPGISVGLHLYNWTRHDKQITSLLPGGSRLYQDLHNLLREKHK